MSIKDPPRKYDMEYLKILSQKLQNVPAWKDFALATQEVLGREVDERRRRLEKIKDSVRYRRGDTLVDVVYNPEAGREAKDDEGETYPITPGFVIRTAKVKNVIKNLAYFQNSNSTDYLDLEFKYKNEVLRWLMPIQIPQERDALLKNSYIMGFDFFNNKLNDEDLQRLYEFIQLYWNESGTSDNFMKFIGFIKNARFDLVPLWSYEDEEGKDEYPVLEPQTTSMKSVTRGGKWYLTSHVEIRYDLAQFGGFYTLNLDDLETLFYYFAPIILVLERIVGSLDIESDIAILSVNDLTGYNYDVEENEFEHQTPILNLMAGGGNLTNYSLEEIDYEQVDRLVILSTGNSVLINSSYYSLERVAEARIKMGVAVDLHVLNYKDFDVVGVKSLNDSSTLNMGTATVLSVNNYGVIAGTFT